MICTKQVVGFRKQVVSRLIMDNFIPASHLWTPGQLPAEIMNQLKDGKWNKYKFDP
jgi:hypothetical protein